MENKKIKIKKIIYINYCGSLIQQNFGENVTKHGFLFWDIESKTFTEHDVDNRFLYYQFRIKSIEDIENGTEIITNL
jgi:hypothetical protein